VGKLIGLLVEEKSEIATVDVSKYTQAAKKNEAPKATETQKPPTTQQT
jgi:hypothetical protein